MDSYLYIGLIFRSLRIMDIMGSQVTGSLEIPGSLRHTHPNPSFLEGPMILRVMYIKTNWSKRRSANWYQLDVFYSYGKCR